MLILKNAPLYFSIGLSNSPKMIFKKLGIDIADNTFWDKGIDEVETLLEETSQLAQKLGNPKNYIGRVL